VQAESPVVARQDSDGLLEVVEGGAGQLGPGSQKFSKSTVDSVSASPAPLTRSHSSPSPIRIVPAHCQIPLLVASRLRQQVVGDPHAEVAAAGELHDGGVVAGEVL